VFLAETARRTGRKLKGSTPSVAGHLLQYEWPGNVREVQNAVEHAVALAAGRRVDVEDLPRSCGRRCLAPNLQARRGHSRPSSASTSSLRSRALVATAPALLRTSTSASPR
jgi:DNA-binding NtrC family response regulator